ncbi:MAG: bifunctional hydroxymethylpyrimidine kinase/phosphomethylpyrimidine kinase [Pacificimonas sp.]
MTKAGPPRILAIAGSDSSGGAGIQADIKSITMTGGYAMTAITAVTAQNTVGVQRIDALPIASVTAQIASCLDDIGVDAVKTGMLGNPRMIRAVFSAISGLGVPVIVDPVMVATSGDRLVGDDALGALRRIALPAATVLTPNIPELALLDGEEIDDVDTMVAAATRLARDYNITVLAKGGHLISDRLTDVLVRADGEIARVEEGRIDTESTHGTGCSLASALASHLAQGADIETAFTNACAYVRRAIADAPTLGRGHGPLAHGWPLTE